MRTKSARTPLFATLRAALQEVALPLERQQELERRRYSRREALKLLGASGVALGLSTTLSACHKRVHQSETSGPRIAIVGAGIGGLNTAHHLKKAGLDATIYEAALRPGGRCHSTIDLLGPGLVTELGGEFLDSTHLDMLSLAKEFKLEVYDVKGPGEEKYIEAYSFGERLYSNESILEAFRPAAARIAQDAAVFATWTDVPSPQVLDLDRTSLSEYLERIGVQGWLKDLIRVAYVTEYGIDADQQSALNLICLISTDTQDQEFDLYGSSDERYKIRGGNQRIPNALAQKYQDHIRYGHLLESIAERNGRYRLTFQREGSVAEVDADIVVVAIPFTLLRSVNLPDSFPPQKLQVIRELGYGMNSKMLMGFNSRPWRDLGYSGSFFSGTPYQSGWDNSRAQHCESGGMTIFLGGKTCTDSAAIDAADYAKKSLPWVGRLFSKCDLEFNGKTGKFYWPGYPFSHGSYSVYKTGQWTSFAGQERTPVGNIFFAGEHCSEDFQGFMNGAAESGRFAARDIVAKLEREQLAA
ncbi:MAG: FAD-dependent oxidoreductase [Deltaproteobacteria bacterium]|nr:FAD-dependent oxidoreductase [Deltaproteobacteria bacterium]